MPKLTISLPKYADIDEAKGIAWLDRLSEIVLTTKMDKASKAEIFHHFVKGLEFDTPEEIWECACLMTFAVEEAERQAETDKIANKVLKRKH